MLTNFTITREEDLFLKRNWKNSRRLLSVKATGEYTVVLSGSDEAKKLIESILNAEGPNKIK
jgi:hypothetical protein